MTILVILKLGTSNALTHLTPIARAGGVNKIHIIRESRLPVKGKNIKWYTFSSNGPPRSLIKMFFLGCKVLKENKIDLIITFNPVPYGTVAWALARIWKIPISMSLIGDDINVHCHRKYGVLLHYILRRCNWITVPGNCYIKDMIAWGISGESISVLPHSIDLNRFKKTRSIKDRKYNFIFVGDLLPLKRIDVIIKAFTKVFLHFPSSSIVVVGDGSERKKLENIAAESSARNAIHFVGRQENVEEYYNDSKILLLTSIREGLPLVLLEAMACGCVPITTDRGAIGDYIQNGINGILLKSGDADEVANHCQRLLENHALLEALSTGAEDIREKVDWKKAETVWSSIVGSMETGEL